MAYYNKIGLLVLNAEATAFLVCEPRPDDEDKARLYLMPGGKIEGSETDVECLTREIKEELDCAVDTTSLELVGECTDVASGHPDRDVMIRLYRGQLIGEPKPSSEIAALHWVGRDSVSDPMTSPIVKNKIIPDLVKRRILK